MHGSSNQHMVSPCTRLVSGWLHLQVVLTAILWGAGTALGEVPPYLLSYSAAAAGRTAEALQEIEEVRGHSGDGDGGAGGCSG